MKVLLTFLYLSSPKLIENDPILCFLTIKLLKYQLRNTLSHVCFEKMPKRWEFKHAWQALVWPHFIWRIIISIKLISWRIFFLAMYLERPVKIILFFNIRLRKFSRRGVKKAWSRKLPSCFWGKWNSLWWS